MQKAEEIEYTVKELSDIKAFPYRERMIRHFIKEGRLNVVSYGFAKLKIPKSSVDDFMKWYKETKGKSKNSK